MFKRLIFCLLFLSGFFFSALAMERANIVAISSDGGSAKIAGSGIKVGRSGFVLRKLANEKEIVIARVVVESAGDGGGVVKFEMFDNLAQDALPRPIIAPKEGDSVGFGVFGNKSVAIAKSQQEYLLITRSAPTLNWLHPDLFAAYLVKERKPQPKAKEFSAFCKEYGVETLYLGINKNIYETDCFSLKVLSTKELGGEVDANATTIVPFFSRVGKVEGGFFGFGGAQVENFDAYYKELLGIK